MTVHSLALLRLLVRSHGSLIRSALLPFSQASLCSFTHLRSRSLSSSRSNSYVLHFQGDPLHGIDRGRDPGFTPHQIFESGVFLDNDVSLDNGVSLDNVSLDNGVYHNIICLYKVFTLTNRCRHLWHLLILDGFAIRIQ